MGKICGHYERCQEGGGWGESYNFWWALKMEKELFTSLL